MSLTYERPTTSAALLVDGPAPTYAHRLTLAQRIVNAGLVRWHFCRFEHQATVEAKRHERSHGFTTPQGRTYWARRREYLRDVLAHDPGVDPDWWLSREWLLESDANWLLEQRQSGETFTTEQACAFFAERSAA